MNALDATKTASLVRAGQATAVELVDSAINRIEKSQDLNAVVIPLYEQAVEEARVSQMDGPLAGVPILLKDLFGSYKGAPETEGSRFLRDHIAEIDSEFVSRLKSAGAIIIGKTNAPEFGNMSTTEPRLYGATHNPWNHAIIPGGSSGGSAASVAARLVPVAHGNDGGGSIRIPASCCGVFGLKPTRGRVSFAPTFGEVFGGLVTQHVLTVTVRDSALVLDVVSGHSIGDVAWPPPPERPFVEDVRRDPGRLRIAFSSYGPAGNVVHADCRDAVESAALLCEELGHVVVEAQPEFDWEVAESAFFSLWAESNAWLVDIWARRIGRFPERSELEPLTWALVEEGRKRSAADHLVGITDLQSQARKIARFFEAHDLWLTPTLAEPPVPLGTFDAPPENPMLSLERDGEFSPFTWIANVTGQPAMSIPLWWNRDNLPIGVHFACPFGREDMLFQLASQIEVARPWVERVPERFELSEMTNGIPAAGA